MTTLLPYLIVTAVFLAYFALHSLTASIMMKQWVAKHWPDVMPYYRLTFNGLALALSIPLLVVLYWFPGESLWQWQGMGFYLTSAIALLAVIGFFYSLKYYDLSEFWGTRQLKEHNTSIHDQENFHISPMHRYVRHPWYFLALVIIWTRDVSTVQLLAYSMVTAYFVIGSRMEERKLIAYHGEVYKKYQQKVAGVLPLPWKFMTQDQAKQMLDEYQ
ncbi:MAG: hypothetical protein GY694_16810 [Gammaproteobacteria bacterium]|nr:hypothetical protein [Gammaproteobacteria bacterium]